MIAPHKICCQWCYACYELCNGKDCTHDVHPETETDFGIHAGSAYVGFCSSDCRKIRVKGSRVGQFIGGEI